MKRTSANTQVTNSVWKLLQPHRSVVSALVGIRPDRIGISGLAEVHQAHDSSVCGIIAVLSLASVREDNIEAWIEPASNATQEHESLLARALATLLI